MNRWLLAVALLAGLSDAAETNTSTTLRRDAWFTKAELEKVARHHVLVKKIQFSFEGTTSSVSYRRIGTNLVATICFGSELGKPVFTADIDHTETVLTNSIGIAVCAIGRTP